MGILEGGLSPSFHTIFQGGDQVTDINYTLPPAQGATGTVLTNDGSGILSWGVVTSGLWTESGSNVYYDTGNVGIGTTDPKSPLHVVGTGDAGTIRIEHDGEADIQFLDNQHIQNWQVGTNNVGFYIYDNDYRMVVEQIGRASCRERV